MKNTTITFITIGTITTILILNMFISKSNNQPSIPNDNVNKENIRQEEIENINTLKNLYEKYKDGEIQKCKHNNETIYMASLNAYDAGSSIYDKNGNEITNCNFAWGRPDKICEEITNCETIYRVKNNIWKEPKVDKYRLNKNKIK